MAYLLTKTLTDKEAAFLALGWFTSNGNEQKMNFTRLYTLAAEDSNLKPETAKTYASTWKNSPKVRAFLRDLQNRDKDLTLAGYEDGKRKTLEEVKNESGGTNDNGSEAGRDFTNPENQKRLLNELINSATDPHDKLDAVKVIISGQRDDRQAAREQKQVRFYLAQRCTECPLYQSFKTTAKP